MKRLAIETDTEATFIAPEPPECIVLLDGVPVGTLLQEGTETQPCWVAYRAVERRGDEFGHSCGQCRTASKAARTLPAVALAISEGQL